MVKALVCDFSRVILFPTDIHYRGSLNDLHKKKSGENEYAIFDHFKINTELLEYLKTISDKVDLYILTSETIQEATEFHNYLYPLFKKIYSAGKVGLSKQDPEIYKWVCQDIHLRPEEVVFIDDSEVNIRAARMTGLITFQYNSNKQVITQIQQILSENQHRED